MELLSVYLKENYNLNLSFYELDELIDVVKQMIKQEVLNGTGSVVKFYA
jgi:hypothetical protein